MEEFCGIQLPTGRQCARPAVMLIPVDAEDIDEPSTGGLFDQDAPPESTSRMGVCARCARLHGLRPPVPPSKELRPPFPEPRMFEGQPIAEEYLGLEAQVARRRARADQAVEDLAVLDLDQIEGSFLLTCDLRPHRLNLVIRRGYVVEAAWC